MGAWETKIRCGFNCKKREGPTHWESKIGKDSVSSGFECKERAWTHNLGDENGVSSVFKCHKADGPTLETKVE